MEITTKATPSDLLFASKQHLLEADRAALLRRIDDVSIDLGEVVRSLLDSRVVETPTRPIGELWPWLLADIAGIPESKVRPVSQAWLAIYLYTLLMDRECDEPWRARDPKTFLAGTLLFEIGLGDLCELTAGTPWSVEIRCHLRKAIQGQLGDVSLQTMPDQANQKRINNTDKNSGFAMCAAAFAVAGGIDPTALLHFARTSALAFQHLDDIGDFESDFRAMNITPLLELARFDFSSGGGGAKRYEFRRDCILAQLIESDSLKIVLEESIAILSEAFDVVSKYHISQTTASGVQYLHNLVHTMRHTVDIVTAARQQLSDPQRNVQDDDVLRTVERSLQIVSQQS